MIYTWTGNENSDWTNPNNWSPVGVPTSTDISYVGNYDPTTNSYVRFPNDPIINSSQNIAVTNLYSSGNPIITVYGSLSIENIKPYSQQNQNYSFYFAIDGGSLAINSIIFDSSYRPNYFFVGYGNLTLPNSNYLNNIVSRNGELDIHSETPENATLAVANHSILNYSGGSSGNSSFYFSISLINTDPASSLIFQNPELIHSGVFGLQESDSIELVGTKVKSINLISNSPFFNGKYHSDVMVTLASGNQIDVRNAYFNATSLLTKSTDGHGNTFLTLQPPTTTIDVNTPTVIEGNTAAFTAHTNYYSGTILNYSLSGVSSSDIAGHALTGTVVVDDNGDAKITIPTSNQSVANSKTLTLSINGVNASETLTFTPTYSVLAKSTSVDYTGNATFYLSTNLAAGTSVPYTISGNYLAGAVSGGNSGSVIVDSNGSATIVIKTYSQHSYGQYLNIDVNGASAKEYLNVVPLPNPISYSVTASRSSINEGDNVVFTITAKNMPEGGLVPYQIYGVTLQDIQNQYLLDNAVVDKNGIATITVQTLKHNVNQGNKVLELLVNGTSASVTLIDTAPVPVSDFYDGKYLKIANVKMNGVNYSNVIVTLDKILSINNATSVDVFDSYDSQKNILSMPSVINGFNLYKNALASVSSIVSIDGKLPLLSTSVPNHSTSISASTNLTFTFSDAITLGAGNITITKPDNSKEFVNVLDSKQVTVSGNHFTILANSLFPSNGIYSFSIPSGIIHGASGVDFAGSNDYSISIVGVQKYASGY